MKLFNKLHNHHHHHHAAVPKILKIGSHTLQIVRLLAEGGFAMVYLARDTTTRAEFALKRSLCTTQSELSSIRQEYELQKQLSSHTNIVSVYEHMVDTSRNPAEVYILMEYCDGELMNKISRAHDTNTLIPETEVLHIFREICKGVFHMHSQDPPTAHRDIKIENVLLCGEKIKLCDFGSATTKHIRPTSKHEIGLAEVDIQNKTTMQYRAPEQIDLFSKKSICEKVDIWALGCLLYKLCFLSTPFEEDEGFLQILNVKYSIPSDSSYSHSIHALLPLMLNPDPVERISAKELLEKVDFIMYGGTIGLEESVISSSTIEQEPSPPFEADFPPPMQIDDSSYNQNENEDETVVSEKLATVVPEKPQSKRLFELSERDISLRASCSVLPKFPLKSASDTDGLAPPPVATQTRHRRHFSSGDRKSVQTSSITFHSQHLAPFAAGGSNKVVQDVSAVQQVPISLKDSISATDKSDMTSFFPPAGEFKRDAQTTFEEKTPETIFLPPPRQAAGTPRRMRSSKM